MSRRLGRVLLLAVVTVLAVGSGLGTVQADEGAFSPVPRSRLAEKPYRGVALVTVEDRVVCTGFVVGPRKVVTAAHCLVRDAGEGEYRLKNGLPGKLKVYRGYSRAAGGTAYRACDVARFWAHPKFVRKGPQDPNYGSRPHDYAVLTTEQDCVFPANSVLRMWATDDGDGQLEEGERVRAAGYPADRRFKDMDGLNLWRTEGRVRPIQIDPRHLVFTGFISSGMSGGPVWGNFPDESPCGRTQCVVGIVTECEVNGKGFCKQGLSDRLAVRITRQVKGQIQRH